MREKRPHFHRILLLITICLALVGCSAADALTDDIRPHEAETTEEETVSSETAAEQIVIAQIEENKIPLTASSFGADTAGQVRLPSRYDSREAGRAAPVRDQENLGTCWAFASLSALESRLLPEEVWDFSEDHMSHDPYFRLGQTGGGEYTMAMAYLLGWRGPVREEDDPYGDQVSPQGLDPVKHVQEIIILPDNDPDTVKRAVMEMGSVETSIYMDLRYINDRSDFYDPDTASYCCTAQMAPNHDITIIGWDDDFPKEAFTQPVRRNGAFLCENNWGTQFGQDGYFYVSYEDRTIGNDNIIYPEIEPVTNYSQIFQCDACGWIGQMGYGEESAWAANVYQADKNTDLAAAGFYAIDRNTEYEVYVARNIPEDPEDADLADHEKVASGRLSYAGFYTIPFDREVTISAGERFAVIIHLTTPGAIHPIAIEYDAGDGKCVVVLDGESYASFNGKNWENTQSSQECDVCLKAYAR